MASGQDYFNYTPLFIGTSLREPLLASEIQRYKKSFDRPEGRAYVVTPDSPSKLVISSYMSQNIVHIQATLAQFVDALAKEFPDGLSIREVEENCLIENGFNTDQFTSNDVDKLRSFIPSDYHAVHSNTMLKPVEYREREGRKYYLGFGPSVETIAFGHHCVLEEYKRVRRDVANFIQNNVSRCIVVQGQSGSGKSTCVIDAVLDYSRSNPDVPVFRFEQNPSAPSIVDSFRALSKLNSSRIAVIVDNLDVYADDIGAVIKSPWASNLKIISSARQGDWSARIERQLGSAASTTGLTRFSVDDASQLVEKLITFVAAPILTKLSRPDRTNRFLKSKRQLLIAMKEAVGGQEFDSIISNEFLSIPNDEHREMFVLVAVSTLARVGLHKDQSSAMLRLSDRSISADSILAGLTGIVEVDASNRLVARHELYARYILDSVCPVNEVHKAFQQMLDYFTNYKVPVIRNIGKKDGHLFKFLLNANTIKRRFSTRGADQLAVNLYSRYEIKLQLDGHYWLQYGLHKRNAGESEEALRMFKLSTEAYPDNAFAEHAYAQQLLIQATRHTRNDADAHALAEEGAARLLELHARQYETADQYPILTLTPLHIEFLLSRNQKNKAVKMAKYYFDKLVEIEKMHPKNASVERMKRAALLMGATGEWENPNLNWDGEDD